MVIFCHAKISPSQYFLNTKEKTPARGTRHWHQSAQRKLELEKCGRKWCKSESDFINIGASCLSPYFLSVNPTTPPSLTGLPSQLQKAFSKPNIHIGHPFLAEICFFFLPKEQHKNKSTPTTLCSPWGFPRFPHISQARSTSNSQLES